ncbi:MAG TPA: hypothetical protein VI958_13380, partial [Acidobacteriota bacterium]
AQKSTTRYSKTAQAAEQKRKFQYQPEKIRTGALYHYVKSNRDGSVPENVAVYVASRDNLEVFKYRAPGTAAGFVKAWIDWEIFSAHKLESYRVTGADEQKLVATFEFSKSDGIGSTNLFLDDEPAQEAKISTLPFHIFNFDFTSLNFAFRHLVNLRDSFEIGVPDFVFRNEKWEFIYRGAAIVQFQGEETLDRVRCLRYSIDGPGLENRGGAIWVNAAQGHVERMDLDLPDNPDWDHFFFELKKVEFLSPKEWQKFRESHFERS